MRLVGVFDDIIVMFFEKKVREIPHENQIAKSAWKRGYFGKKLFIFFLLRNIACEMINFVWTPVTKRTVHYENFVWLFIKNLRLVGYNISRAGEPANFLAAPAPGFFQEAPAPRSQKHPAPAPQPWIYQLWLKRKKQIFHNSPIIIINENKKYSF